jgi:hypothetical protein
MDERGNLGRKKLLAEFKKASDRHRNFIKRVMVTKSNFFSSGNTTMHIYFCRTLLSVCLSGGLHFPRCPPCILVEKTFSRPGPPTDHVTNYYVRRVLWAGRPLVWQDLWLQPFSKVCTGFRKCWCSFFAYRCLLLCLGSTPPNSSELARVPSKPSFDPY